MKIAVLGCGAIGGLFLGYLQEKGISVFGVAKPYQVDELVKGGLVIEGVRGTKRIKNFWLGSRLQEKFDLAVFAVKIQDLEAAVMENLKYLKDVYVLSTQNGIAADYILEKHFERNKIITGIVMFGATGTAPNKVVHNFEGELILGNIFGERIEGMEKIKTALEKAFNVEITDDIKGKKYLKVFVNLTNCITGCLGKSMQEAFSDVRVCQIAIGLIKEAYKVVTESRVVLTDLPTYPKSRVEGLANMQTQDAAGLFSKIMVSLSKEPLYGSILQSIKRGKPSEIDYINGEITRLAEKNNLIAPLNEKMVNLVHKVETDGRFFSKEELLKEYGKDTFPQIETYGH